MAIDRGQDVIAWSRQVTDGAFESLATIPSEADDVVYAIVRREINGQTVRYAHDTIGPTFTYAGTGVFSPTFFADVPDGTVMKLRPLLDAGIARGVVSGEHHAGRWVDVGTPARLAELDHELSLLFPEKTV